MESATVPGIPANSQTSQNMAFGTYKSCHGCGETGWKPVNSLCKRCEADLRAGQAVKAVDEEKLGGRLVFRLTPTWPPVYCPGLGYERSKALGEAFAVLARAVFPLLKSRKEPYGSGVKPFPPTSERRHYTTTYEDGAVLVTAKKKTADALLKVDTLVREALFAVQEDGKRDGQNLLLQLARGEMTVKQLSDEHVGES